MSQNALGITSSLSGQAWNWRRSSADMASENLAPDDLIAQLLLARGVLREDLERQRNPTLRSFMPDPSLFKDMDAAAARIADAVEAQEPITIFGTGEQTRSFCYCTDLIEGLVRLMNSEDDDFTGPVNLGNPKEYTIFELARHIARALGRDENFIFKPLPEDDPHRRQPDITLAKERLGWEPTIQLDEGLAETIRWFKGIDIDSYRPPTPKY